MAESNEKKTVAERAADLSEDVLESIRDQQQTVIEAMRKFVDRLDEMRMPGLVDPSVRKKVVDAIGATTSNSPRRRTSSWPGWCAAPAGR